MKAIKDGEVFGFIQCDVSSPDEMIAKHLKNGFLFPPVITKQTIEDDMLSPFMKELHNQNPKKPEASPVQTYHGDNVFLFTPMVQLYLDIGLKISNITEVVQYYPGKCFLPFANRVVQLRSEATRDGDDAKQLTAKLFGNSGKYESYYMAYNNSFVQIIHLNNSLGYGKQAENVLKHSVTKLVTDYKELDDYCRNPFYRHDKEVYDENNELACYLVKMDKKKITDSKPVHIGVAILQWSKVLFIRYVTYKSIQKNKMYMI